MRFTIRAAAPRSLTPKSQSLIEAISAVRSANEEESSRKWANYNLATPQHIISIPTVRHTSSHDLHPDCPSLILHILHAAQYTGQ
jgi:hypothetical protein